VWDPAKGDGVGFEIAVEVNGRREVVYQRVIDPKHNPAHRHWLDDAVDLTRFAGRPVILILSTDPLTNGASDWAGWGDLRLTAAAANEPQQYERVYNAEVQIFENRAVLPRAFLVGQVMPVVDRDAALATMQQGSIDPGAVAIVEAPPAAAVAALRPGPGEAAIRRYTAGEVVIDVRTAEPAFLVLTDSYYPGWEATVDGRATAIYATDLAFRGIFVPGGAYQVVFAYRPASFSLGVQVALVGLVALVGAGAWPRHVRFRRGQHGRPTSGEAAPGLPALSGNGGRVRADPPK
jgi:hypothetical protein